LIEVSVPGISIDPGKLPLITAASTAGFWSAEYWYPTPEFSPPSASWSIRADRSC
jgi:hypothetical protein